MYCYLNNVFRKKTRIKYVGMTKEKNNLCGGCVFVKMARNVYKIWKFYYKSHSSIKSQYLKTRMNPICYNIFHGADVINVL